MRRACAGAALTLLLGACAGHDRLTTVDTRDEQVDHRRLAAPAAGVGAGIASYSLGASEGYRMPQLYTGPSPQVGDRDPRSALPPTVVCLQVVVTAEGTVERSVPLTDRPDCSAGNAPENAVLLQAAQEAVAQWRYAPAAVCHFAAGQVPENRGDCATAERVEPVAVSLLYAFTFEIVKGQHVVRSSAN